MEGKLLNHDDVAGEEKSGIEDNKDIAPKSKFSTPNPPPKIDEPILKEAEFPEPVAAGALLDVTDDVSNTLPLALYLTSLPFI